jgi:hypothetical protein
VCAKCQPKNSIVPNKMATFYAKNIYTVEHGAYDLVGKDPRVSKFPTLLTSFEPFSQSYMTKSLLQSAVPASFSSGVIGWVTNDSWVDSGQIRTLDDYLDHGLSGPGG